MNAALEEAMSLATSEALTLKDSTDPFKVENGEAIMTVLGAVRRLRSVALATGVPEVLVDKIALDQL